MSHKDLAYCLVPLLGDEEQPVNLSITLSASEQIVGRSPQAHLVIPLATISRQHAAIWTSEGVPYLKDLGSQHGTFVNSLPITGPTMLHDGDLVSFGRKVVFLLRQQERETALQAQETAELITDSALTDLALSTAPAGRARRHLQAICALADEITRGGSENNILGVAIEELLRALAADRTLALLGEDPERLTIAARQLADSQTAAKWSLPSRTIVAEAFGSDRPVLSFDAKTDERFRKRPSVEVSNVRSVVCAGIRAQGRALGVIYADNQMGAGKFTLEDGKLVRTMAQLVAHGLIHHHLRAEARSSQQGVPIVEADALEPLRAELSAHLERLESLARASEEQGRDATLARQLSAERRRLHAAVEAIFAPPRREATTIGVGDSLPSISRPFLDPLNANKDED